MTTINELKKKYNINKDELITGLDEDELKNKILMLTKNYYVAYFNNDEKLYKATLNILEFINELYSSINEETDYYNNVPNFTNYCMVLSMNMLLSDLFERDFTLKEPYFTDLKERRHESIAETLMNNGMADDLAWYGVIEDSDMLRSDADLETVKSIYPQLKMTLTPHCMEWIDNFIKTKEHREAAKYDKEYGWRKDL
ncbi:MAG: hypothetical protein J6D47_01460 [Peptostreptococcaceae bacterium]|nr:hypothetical protein [Peptostreptococcaceae bacterium]